MLTSYGINIKINLVRGDHMCFLNAIEACLLYNHSEVLNIKSIIRIMTSEIKKCTISFIQAMLLI